MIEVGAQVAHPIIEGHLPPGGALLELVGALLGHGQLLRELGETRGVLESPLVRADRHGEAVNDGQEIMASGRQQQGIASPDDPTLQIGDEFGDGQRGVGG